MTAAELDVVFGGCTSCGVYVPCIWSLYLRRTLCAFCLEAVSSADFMCLLFRGRTFGGLCPLSLEAMPSADFMSLLFTGCTFSGFYVPYL